MGWLDNIASKVGPDWHSTKTTWPHGEETKEYFESRDEAEQNANNPLFDSDFKHEVNKEDGPSSDPDQNQAHSWLGQWQADRARDPEWEMSSPEDEEKDRSDREAAMTQARQESGYFRDEQDIEDQDRRDAITDRWDTEGHQDNVDYQADYEKSLDEK